MRRLALVLLVAVTGLLSPLAHATACPQRYAPGQTPVIVKASLKARTQEICFRAYAVMHSGLSRTPPWSAEHLVRERVQAAGDLARKDSFHAETALPAADRAELSDYARSGFDRGHMAPNSDMPDAARPRGSAMTVHLYSCRVASGVP